MTTSDDSGADYGARVFDVVIVGGRVIDPETGLDAVRNVGIDGGTIVAVTDAPLQGRVSINAADHVVAPGFIDLHSHGQSIAEMRLKAFDGVTTALELEAGVASIETAYRETAAQGRPINYGFSTSWAALRMQVLDEGIDKSKWAADELSADIGSSKWREGASSAQRIGLLNRLSHELSEGALGIGILLGYVPETDPEEYLSVAGLAAEAAAVTFTHARPLIEQDPEVLVDGAEELTRAAGETGAHMHYCHINSTSNRHLDRVQGLVDRVRSEGARITTEAYPYGAAMTAIGADFFHPDRLHLLGATGTPADVIYAKTGETPLTVERLVELRTQDPGGWAFLKQFDEDKEPHRLAEILSLPECVIASDGMPLVVEPGEQFNPEQWPLPPSVRMHPRGAGTYGRTLRVGVRETGALTLPEAIARCGLYPARILEATVPAMRNKGRIQVGCDADVVVFDPQTVTDRATYLDSTRTTSGFSHVLVHGQPVVTEGELVEQALPGQAVRAPR